MTVSEARQHLEDVIAGIGRFAVAYSGGVDSTLVLAVAHRVLGDDAVALTVETPYTARWEGDRAAEMARRLGVVHHVLSLSLPPELAENPPLRCLYCKRRILEAIRLKATALGFDTLADGSNADDPGEHRPGMKAIAEFGVRSPLLEAGLTKASVRELSRAEGLSTWDQPAFSCLLTRLPHGMEVREADLRQIERSELALMSLGFPAVRVRHHGDVARIEVPEADIERASASGTRERIVAGLREAGYRYVALDIAGYHTGSMEPPKE